MNEQQKRILSRGLLLAAVALGSVTGLGMYTFQYAEGLSYFSTDPNACANCHIMQPQLDSWQKSGHHHVATCVDCHLPHDFIAKYIAKAENGYHHSKGFTFQDFHEPILIKDKNADILQANCIYCHEDVVHALRPGEKKPQQAMKCVHCHATVGHGPRAGLGGAYSLRELEGVPYE
ncbi:MAG: cytochrome c nitrite reductase small subunit [Kiritimatiellae bacterium]|jgi:cytochrome c nitrite reductase small subunit|nr:cytochrome c nitrite reductase small subunit [Kiritimatiellia bacterium]